MLYSILDLCFVGWTARVVLVLEYYKILYHASYFHAYTPKGRQKMFSSTFYLTFLFALLPPQSFLHPLPLSLKPFPDFPGRGHTIFRHGQSARFGSSQPYHLHARSQTPLRSLNCSPIRTRSCRPGRATQSHARACSQCRCWNAFCIYCYTQRIRFILRSDVNGQRSHQRTGVEGDYEVARAVERMPKEHEIEVGRIGGRTG